MNKTLFSSILAAAAFTMATPSPALAQPSSADMFVEPTVPAAASASESYRGQIALVGAGSIGLLLAGYALDSDALFGGGVVGLTLGPPIVHAANGNTDDVGMSLLLHVLLPGAAGAIGIQVGAALAPTDNSSGWNFDQLIWAYLGAAVGVGAGIAGSYLYDFLRASKPAAKKPRERMVGPTVVPRDGGATFGLVGAF